MKVPIRTLSQRDVEILARNTIVATVTKGYVEHHGLRWSSPSLHEWMLRQQQNHRSRKVEVLIDELDLSVVFIVLPAEAGRPESKIRARSTQPQYTTNLSLYEHEKLKAAIKAKHQHSRLVRMADSELLRLRTEYYALLGRQGDPISARRLEKLRDQLAERRLSDPTSKVVADVTPTAAQASLSPLPKDSPPKAPKRRRRIPEPAPPSVDGEPLSPTATPLEAPQSQHIQDEAPGQPPLDISTPGPSGTRTPIYPCTRIKRKHR